MTPTPKPGESVEARVRFCPYCGSSWLAGVMGDLGVFGCADCHERVPRDIRVLLTQQSQDRAEAGEHLDWVRNRDEQIATLQAELDRAVEREKALREALQWFAASPNRSISDRANATLCEHDFSVEHPSVDGMSGDPVGGHEWTCSKCGLPPEFVYSITATLAASPGKGAEGEAGT